MKRILLLATLLAAAAGPAAAQTQPPRAQPAPQLLDRIVAIVGDTILLNSDVEEQLSMLEASGQQVPRSDSVALRAIRNQVLEGLIEKLVLLHAAKRDTTVKIDETRVESEVDKQIEQRKTQLGGQVQFEQALRRQRMTQLQFREMLGADIRKEMMQQFFLQKRMQTRKPPPISEKLLRDEFEKVKNTLQDRPATISFTQVVMPASSDSARKIARLKADSILGLIRAGEDFATLAKRYSEDPASKEQGGDLGWQRASMWVPEFAAALQRLRLGEVSPVVETAYGFHIIKLEKVKGAERQARHILIRPVTSEEGAEQVMARATQIANKIKAGADIDSIARTIGDPDERVRLGPLEPGRLRDQNADPAYQDNLNGGNLQVGQVVGPFRIGAGGGPEKVVVLKITDVRAVGKYSWDDPEFRAQFRRNIEQRRLIEEIIAELKSQTFIQLRS
jgi:peptidyl-prolyl cis-trans isomerase SurA